MVAKANDPEYFSKPPVVVCRSCARSELFLMGYVTVLGVASTPCIVQD